MTNQTQTLLLSLVLSQLQVYCIDEIQKDNKLWQQDLKALCNKMTPLIIRKHGPHINKLFEAQNGEWILQFNQLVDKVTQNMVKMGIIQFGALHQFTEMLLENPSITMEESEKDKFVRQTIEEKERLKKQMAKAQFEIKMLASRVKDEQTLEKITLIQSILKPTN
jgi:hypothetical protein